MTCDDERSFFRTDKGTLPKSSEDEPLLARPPLHGQHIEGVEVVDDLAQRCIYLVACDEHDGALRVELGNSRDQAVRAAVGCAIAGRARH